MEEKMYENLYRLDDRHWWFRARKNIVLRLINKYFRPKSYFEVGPRSSRKIFDIGCGTGMILQSLSKYGEQWGIDSDRGVTDFARQKNPAAKIIHGFFPQDAPSEKFDLVTALDVLEHINDDEAALSKIYDVLKPGGLAVVTVPALAFLWTGHDIASHHKRRYCVRELGSKLKNAGLRVEKISYCNTFLFLPIAVAKIAQRALFRNKVRSHLDGDLPIPWMNKLLEAVFSAEKYLLSGVNFPFGISIIAVASKPNDQK